MNTDPIKVEVEFNRDDITNRIADKIASELRYEINKEVAALVKLEFQNQIKDAVANIITEALKKPLPMTNNYGEVKGECTMTELLVSKMNDTLRETVEIRDVYNGRVPKIVAACIGEARKSIDDIAKECIKGHDKTIRDGIALMLQRKIEGGK